MPKYDSQERARLIEQYAAGPARLRTAWEAVPPEARDWRPQPGEWSTQEVVCHCGDAETNAAMRIRYVVAEPQPVIQGYDGDNWSRELDYAAHPAEAALLTVDAVRANTTALLRRLPPEAWERSGTHTESGPYSAEDWLGIYSKHLEEHATQIEGLLAAWRTQQ